ncbi:MAG TPA: VOC family protein [Bryobacteraceae bacterium]|nr:VOC family protein [Bryobacteraceae bacterium]
MALEIRGLTPLLQVYDMPASIHFYRDLLGFEVVVASPLRPGNKFHWALLRRGDVELMLNTAYEFDEERPVPPDVARVAAHSDTVLYFGCPDVEAAYEELLGRGVKLEPPSVARYGMKQLNVRDPDGYALVFQWREAAMEATRDGGKAELNQPPVE